MFCSKVHPKTAEISLSSPPFSSSACIIANNSDLIREILLYLPVKSLLVCKSVSKQWLSIISDAYFTCKHYLRSRISLPKPYSLAVSITSKHQVCQLFYLDGTEVTESSSSSLPCFESLSAMNDAANITIFQSCNGLFCCRSYRRGQGYHDYFIFNPYTKHYKFLQPASPVVNNLKFSEVCSVSLAFDPLKSIHYEAVCIWRRNHKTHSYHIEIYSSKTKNWRLSESTFTAPRDYAFHKSGVYWNGSLHWISPRIEYSFCFNANQGVVKTMPALPLHFPNDWYRYTSKYFGESNGHMYLIKSHKLCYTRFDVWEMELDYTKWTVKYHVDIQPLIVAYPEMVQVNIFPNQPNNDFYFLLVVEADEDQNVSSKLLIQIADGIISYDLNQLSFRKVHDLLQNLHWEEEEEDYPVTYQSVDAYQCIESLACV